MKKKMTYWVLFPKIIDDGAVLSAVPKGGPKAYKYDKGINLLQNYPDREQAVMVFDRINYPDQSKLYDILPALDTVLVVNNKVKDLLGFMGINHIEYLPIWLWDHKKKPVSDDYYIVNPLGSVDFIDMEKSEYEMDSLDESQIAYIEELVIDYDKIPEDAKLFRATTKMDQLFIHDDVRIAFEKAGIQGYRLFEAEGWDGLDV
jgi:hypothetical protein